jgi:branched-chain amino acid transport system substrate-binding protein
MGELISQTGAVGSTIGPIKIGYDAGIKAINAAGGICGRTIKTVTADTQGNSGVNASAARQLVDGSKVFAITEGDPLAASASAQYLNQQGVPVVGTDSANNAWFQTPVMFPIGNQYKGTATMADWAFTQKRATKFAVMWANIQVSVEGCAAAVKRLKDLGAEIVYTANVPVAAPDASTYAQQARAAGADGIIHCFESSLSVALAKALDKQKWKPYVGMISGGADDTLLKAAPAALLEGFEANFPVPPWTATELPGIREYQAAMKAAYGPVYKNSVWTVRGFAAAKLLAVALEQLGADLTRKRLIAWLNGQNHASLSKLDPALGSLLPPDTDYKPQPDGSHIEVACSMEGRIVNGDYKLVSKGWYCLK